MTPYITDSKQGGVYSLNNLINEYELLFTEDTWNEEFNIDRLQQAKEYVSEETYKVIDLMLTSINDKRYEDRRGRAYIVRWKNKYIVIW